MEPRGPLIRVGWIGLGIMGRPMAENARRVGFQVVAYNRNPARGEVFAASGGRVAGSPREVAALSDVVVTMVSDTPDVEEVVFGANGAAEGMRAGCALVDMSTISPKATREFARRLGEDDGTQALIEVFDRLATKPQ